MTSVTDLMKEHAPDMPSPQDFHSAMDRDREDNPEAAFVTRGLQIAIAVIGAPVLAIVILLSIALLWK